MMRTAIAAVVALSLTACTADPAAHAFLRDQAAARSVDNDDRREPAPAIAFSTPTDRSVMRIADEPEEPMPVVEREPDPERAEAPTVEEEPPIASTEDAPSEEPTPEPDVPDETPPEPEPIEEPEEVEPEPVEDKPNPHPACRRATPPPFC